MTIALARPAAWTSSVTQPVSTARARWALLVVVAAAAVGGFCFGDGQATARAITEAGPELTRLLRGMALLKAALGAAAVAGVLFRLAAPVSRLRFTGYALACAAMAVGVGLIWQMAFLRSGAFLLHAGLLVAVVMLFRDPAVGALLAERIAARRARPARH
jgi:hypothetical protein